MDIKISTSDVTDFLSDMISISSMNQYSVNEEKYILNHNNEKMTYGSPPRHVILYQQTIKDAEAYILNPFVEGVKENNISRWFYTLLWKGLSARILGLMNYVITRAVREHNYSSIKGAAKKKEFLKDYPELEDSVPAPIQKLISAIINDVDDKTLQEFIDLNDHIKKMDKTNHIFLCIYYRRKMLSSSIDIPMITDDDYQYPRSIRKGTRSVFRTLLMRILNIRSPEEMDKYTVKARDNASAKIDSQINCLFNIVSVINEALEAASDQLSIDLSQLKYHIDRIPAYSQNAKGAIYASPETTTKHEPVNVPTTISSSVTTIPGVLKLDGTRGDPVPVSQPLMGYTGPNMQNIMPYHQPPMNPFNNPFQHQPPVNPFSNPFQHQPPMNPFNNPLNPFTIGPGMPPGFMVNKPFG